MKETKRNSEMKKYLQTRLKTIEGQVRGISQMIDDDRYCGDVLIQVSAIEKSLKSLGNDLFKNHLENCVAREIIEGNTSIIDEVMDLIRRLD